MMLDRSMLCCWISLKHLKKVSHPHLAAKLHHYGMQGNTLDWIQSFLSNHTQEVVLEGKRSLQLLSPQAFHRAQFSAPSSSCVTSMTSRTKYPPLHVYLLITASCTGTSMQKLTQINYKMTSTGCRNGRQTG